VVVAWVAEVVVFGVLRPGSFLTAGNFESIASSQAAVLVLALALVPTLSAGEIDLSVASVMTISATLLGQLNGVDHWSLGASVVVALAASLVAGLVNAIVTVFIGVDGIIVTLGMGTLLLGIALEVSNSLTIGGVSNALQTAMNRTFGGISAAFFYALLITIVLWYLFRHTPAGRRILFIGQSREGARLSGIRVSQLRVTSFVLGAFVAGLAGIITVGVAGGIQPSSLQTLLLPAFAAAFLGSAVFVPGKVNAAGTWVAMYFLATGITGVELLGVSTWVSDVFYGGALIIAVTFSRFAAIRGRRRA
jgi:ribose transport system permease protein